MPTYSAILIDDEQAAHYAIQRLLSDYKQIELIAQAYNGKQAVEMINELNPDLIFLDIHMPDMNGFDVIKQLKNQPYIVFCTAYDQYALEAFNQNSIDYLLKPVDDLRFSHCIRKIEKMIPKHSEISPDKIVELSNLLHPPKKASAIPIHVRSKIIFVKCEDIAYCVAKDGYVSIFTDAGKEYVSDLTLKQMEERLPDDFFRVQKSYIVNRTKIEEIQKYFNNRLILILNDKNTTRITTGTSYIDSIREKLQL